MQVRPDIDSVLSQIRQLRQANNDLPSAPINSQAPKVQGDDMFSNLVKGALNQVSELQSDTAELKNAYLKGEDVDIAKVMVASQKSGLAFKATVQVRNKLVEAYQDIMNMPI